MTLKVISWNIRHGLGIDKIQDLDRICAELKKKEADVIAIQEIDRFAKRSKGIDQVEYIANELGYHSSFAKFFNHKTGGEYGLASFSKYPITNTEVINMNPRSSTTNNKALFTEFIFDGIAISHYNFHFPFTRNATCWRNFYKLKFPKNSILSGDFNQNPNGTDIEIIKKKWNDINEHETRPGMFIIDYNFSDMAPIESRVYETISSDHSILETKYFL